MRITQEMVDAMPSTVMVECPSCKEELTVGVTYRVLSVTPTEDELQATTDQTWLELHAVNCALCTCPVENGRRAMDGTCEVHR